MKKIVISLGVAIALTLLSGGRAKALSISPSNGEVTSICDVLVAGAQDLATSEYYLFSVSSGVGLAGGSQYGGEFPVSLCQFTLGDLPTNDFSLGSYALVESDESIYDSCGNHQNNYSDCLSMPSVIGAVTFSVVAPSIPESSRTNIAPRVSIYTPKSGQIFDQSVDVVYEVTDEDYYRGISDFALTDTPITFLYASIDNRAQEFVAAKDTLNIGHFTWDTSNVSDGAYVLILEARDKRDAVVREEVGMVSIDHSAPFFSVEIDPRTSFGEDVTLTIKPSEVLAQEPVVTVLQQGSNDEKQVSLVESGDSYVGTYHVTRGYDGLAKISVVGSDKAGHRSTRIVSGEDFFVGVEPPPKPTVLYPLDKDIVSVKTVTLSGVARRDTEVLVLLNGKTNLKTKPKADGTFSLAISIDPDFNKGLNFLNVRTKDSAGTLSDPVNLTLKYNIKPEAEILGLADGQVVSGQQIIDVKASDENSDVLQFSFEVSDDAGATWVSLAEPAQRSRLTWDTTRFSDGDYIFRVTVSDGFTDVVKVKSGLKIKNFLPVIDVGGTEPIITNKNSALISGHVATAEIEKRPTLALIEYALPGDKDWRVIKEFSASEFVSDFSFTLPKLTEGSTNVAIRAKDSRGLYGRARKVVIVDFGPPVAPRVTSPAGGSVISTSSDDDSEVAGIQIDVAGAAEAGSIVEASVGAAVFFSKTDTNGNFTIPGVTIRVHGDNLISVTATDIAGNISSPATLKVIYNNPPEISFLSPRPGRALGGLTSVRWDAQDPDGDTVKAMTLSYRKKPQDNFTILSDDKTLRKFVWDVTGFADASTLELKVEATDGVTASQRIIPVVIDNTAPGIQLEPLSANAFTKEFVLSMKGQASDALSGVEFVEYTIDGTHWYKATVHGFLKRNADFSFEHPLHLEDGNYDIQIRSVDAAGNISTPAHQAIIVDTLPPRLGSFILSSGILPLLPSGKVFRVPAYHPLSLKVSLEHDTREAKIVAGPSTYDLKKNKATGIWEADLSLSGKDKTELVLAAVDELGNSAASKSLGVVELFSPGIIKNAEGSGEANASVEILVRDPVAREFVHWQGEAYGEVNPVVSGDGGAYSALLPAGEYQVVVRRTGFRTVRSTPFELKGTGFFSSDFKLERRAGFRGFVEDILERVVGF